MNDGASSIKTFHTINYEGSSGWQMELGRCSPADIKHRIEGITFNDNTLNTTSGIKGYHAEFELMYYEANEVANETKAELFAVSNEINISSK